MVGGAVRNALLGEPIGDIDVATTAVPEEVIRRATAAGFKPVPTGIEHGTVTVVIDGRPFEVTTLREDVETFGRHANVRFGRDWKADAERRDFTMNALSVTRRRHGARLCRRARRSRGAPRALHRRCRDSASPRIICASCASSASTPPMATARPMPRACTPASPRARASINCRASACAWNCSSSCWRGTRRRRSRSWRNPACWCRCWAACPISRASRNMAKVEAAAGVQADPVQRLGALGGAHRRGRRAAVAAAAALQCRARAARLDGRRAGGGFRRRTTRAARALLYRLGPERFVDRVLLAWARSPATAHDPAWRALADAAASAGSCRCFRSRPPIS